MEDSWSRCVGHSVWCTWGLVTNLPCAAPVPCSIPDPSRPKPRRRASARFCRTIETTNRRTQRWNRSCVPRRPHTTYRCLFYGRRRKWASRKGAITQNKRLCCVKILEGHDQRCNGPRFSFRCIVAACCIRCPVQKSMGSEEIRNDTQVLSGLPVGRSDAAKRLEFRPSHGRSLLLCGVFDLCGSRRDSLSYSLGMQQMGNSSACHMQRHYAHKGYPRTMFWFFCR